MMSKRWWILAALAISLGAAGWTAFVSREQRRARQAEEEAYARRLGDALIRQGISLYQKGNYSAAITAWERYIKSAPPNADTLSIREMIGEAQGAAASKPVGRPPARKPNLPPASTRPVSPALLRYARTRSLVQLFIDTGQLTSADGRLQRHVSREVGA